MKQTPHSSFGHIKESLIQYIETQYKIANPIIYNERGAILRANDKVAQVPFIEATPSFASANFLHEIENRHDFIPNGLSELVRHGVPVDRHKLYTHQETALLASFGNQSNLLVATGTGSGKTEAFLLPILSKILNEATNWEAPENATLVSRYDEARESWLYGRRYENRPKALRSIILYPMNALVNDQLTRLRRILSLGNSPAWQRANLTGNLIHFGMYTSMTPAPGSWEEEWRRQRVDEYLAGVQQDWDRLPEHHRELGGWPRPGSSEMLLRWDMQEAPPDILVTNYSMLEYMLMRPTEANIFDQTRAWLEEDENAHFTLVLDEAHTYSGAKGTEVAHLIRRLRERLGITGRGKFQAIATTASVPAGADDQLKKFTSDLFGEPENSWTLIRAGLNPPRPDTRAEDQTALQAFQNFHHEFELNAPRPAIQNLATAYGIANVDFTNGDEIALYNVINNNPFIEWLRNRTARNATPLNQIEPECWGNDVEKQLREEATAGLLSAGSFARADQNKGTPPLISIRLHAFFRGVPGLWACIDPNCNCCDQTHPRPVGKIYTEPRPWCDCGARVLEVFTCRHCGLMFLGGIPDNHVNSLWPWSDNLTGEREDIRSFRVFGVEQPDASIQPTYRSTRSTLTCDENNELSRPSYEINGAIQDGTVVSPFPARCPRCQKHRQPGPEGREVIEPLRTRGIQSFATIVEESFRFQPEQTSFSPNNGKKAMVFSDSRREASKLASDLKDHHHNDLFRQCLYHLLWECKVCHGTGVEHLAAEGPPRIGQTPRPVTVECRTCHGSKTDPAPTSLNYEQLKRRVLELQLSNGIDPSRQKIKNIFTALNENWEVGYAKAELFFNADLLKEVSDEVFSFGPLGLGKWEVPVVHNNQVVTNIGEFPNMTTAESYSLIQAALRLLATENVVTAPEPRNAWEWGRDDDNNDIVVLYKRNTTQRLPAIRDLDWRGRVIPFNVSQNRKLGRYIIAISHRLRADGRIANEAAREAWVNQMDEMLWQTLVDFHLLTEAGAVFNFGAARLVPYGIRLNKFVLSPLTGNSLHQCDACRYVMDAPLLNVCLRCGQQTSHIQPDQLRNYFRTNAMYGHPTSGLPDPYPFKGSEHTAQVNSTEARNEERWFQDIFHEGQEPMDFRVDALSVTTTMEMGIDIGSLLFVGLRNVPPTIANYQQRAGRAGRRGSALATVFTFAQPRSHDQYYYIKPKEIVSDPPKVPNLHFANNVIARRHFRSLVLQSFFSEIDFGEANLFKIWGTTRNYLSTHLHERLERFVRNNRNDLTQRSRLILSRDLHGQINNWLNELPGEINHFCEQRDQDNELFSALINSGMLPKYAFPVDVVTLTIPSDNGQQADDESNDVLQRDLKIAISEYAPGAEITRQSDQRTYKYTSVGIHDPFERNPSYVSQGIVIECTSCQHVIIQEDLTVEAPENCPVCNSENLRIMNFIRPKGFTVDGALPHGGREPYNSQEGVERGASLSSAKLLMGENSAHSAQREQWFDGRLNSLINIGNLLIINKGHDRAQPGFHICSGCGRELDPQSPDRHRRPADVPPNSGYRLGPRRGNYCTVQPPYTNDKLVLSHTFYSEVLLLSVNLPADMDAPFTESSGLALWYSFGTLLSMAAARTLQIDTGEIKVGVRALNHNNRIHGEVFIYDDVPGGAGYARAIRNNLEEILRVAREMAIECGNPECTGACYQCMLDYKNQTFHHMLSRDLGLAILDFIIFNERTEMTPEDLELGLNSFSEYARADYTVSTQHEFNPAQNPLMLQNAEGHGCVIRVIHPLQARATTSDVTTFEDANGLALNTFTTFDLIKRPFWALNHIRLL